MQRSKMVAEEGWVDIVEVAAHLRVNKESIYRWVDSKGLPARKVGRLLRFKLSQVDEWVESSSEEMTNSGRSAKTTRGQTNENE